MEGGGKDWGIFLSGQADGERILGARRSVGSSQCKQSALSNEIACESGLRIEIAYASIHSTPGYSTSSMALTFKFWACSWSVCQRMGTGVGGTSRGLVESPHLSCAVEELR